MKNWSWKALGQLQVERSPSPVDELATEQTQLGSGQDPTPNKWPGQGLT